MCYFSLRWQTSVTFYGRRIHWSKPRNLETNGTREQAPRPSIKFFSSLVAMAAFVNDSLPYHDHVDPGIYSSYFAESTVPKATLDIEAEVERLIEEEMQQMTSKPLPPVSVLSFKVL